MKRGLFFIIVVLMGYIFPGNCLGDQTVPVKKIASTPVIDGKADDSVWKQAVKVITHDKIANIDIILKAVYDDHNIYFLVVFPDPEGPANAANSPFLIPRVTPLIAFTVIPLVS